MTEFQSSTKLSWSQWWEQARSSRTAVLMVVCIAIFSDMLIYGVVVPILPTLLRKVNLPEDDVENYVGLLFGVYAVGLVVASPIFGYLSDKYQSRMLPMLAGLLCLALSTLLFAWSESLLGLFLARITQGISASATWVVGLALLADTFPANELGGALGTSMAFNTLGYLIGPTVSGLLTKYASVEMPFYVCAAVCLLDFIGRVIVKPKLNHESTIMDKQTADSEIESMVESQEEVNEDIERVESCAERYSPKGAFSIFFDLNVFLIGIAIMLGGSGICALESIMPLYVETMFGGDEEMTGYLLLAVTIPAMLIDVVAGKLCDRYEGRSLYKVIAVGLLVHAVFIPMFTIPTSLSGFVVMIVLFGASSSFALAPTMPEVAYVAKRLSRDGSPPSYGVLYAIFNEYYYFGMVLGPFLTPYLKEFIGLTWAMSFFSLAILVFLPIYYFSMRHLLKLERLSL